MTPACDRFEREGLTGGEVDAAERDESFAEHLASCAVCQAYQAKYQRLTGAIREVSAGAKRRSDHVARVLASASEGAPLHRPDRPDRPDSQKMRRARWIAPLVAMAAGLALVWWLRRDPASIPPRFAMEILEKGTAVMRGDAQLGDLLRVTAQPGAALWIYRNDRELLLVCPRDCRRAGASMVGELALDAIGHYQVVWLSTDRVPAPSGELERDMTAAEAAGANREMRALEVQ